MAVGTRDPEISRDIQKKSILCKKSIIFKKSILFFHGGHSRSWRLMNCASELLQDRPRRGISVLYKSVRSRSLINQNIVNGRYLERPTLLHSVSRRSHVDRKDVGIPCRNLVRRQGLRNPFYILICVVPSQVAAQRAATSPEKIHHPEHPKPEPLGP